MAILLFAIMACGASDEEVATKPAVDSSVATAVPAASDSTAVVAATVAPTEAPEAMSAEPSGTINYGVPETGIFEGHPRFISSPRVQYAAVTFGESMFAIKRDLTPGPMLATEWSISEDFLTWTIKVREDVQFHKGYGQMTMEDVAWSYKEFHEGALLARATIIGNFWLGNKVGSQEIINEFTIKLNTGVPWVPEVAYEMMRHLGGTSTSITSKNSPKH